MQPQIWTITYPNVEVRTGNWKGQYATISLGAKGDPGGGNKPLLEVRYYQLQRVVCFSVTR
jgi:hypothetical protein